MNNRIYLCSFASEDLNLSVDRFIKQAKSFNYYKEIKVFRPKDLSKSAQERIKKFQIKGKDRYYGFEIWKEDIVRIYLNQIPNNSILQYTDVGCHLNSKGIDKLKEYINITDENNILAFQYGKTPPEIKNKYNYLFQTNREYNFVKGDLVNYLNIEMNDKIMHEPQIWCGAWFIKNNEISKKFLDEWKSIIKNDYLVDDTTSKFQNHNDFKIHLACQASFSLLSKINKIKCISASECEWAEGKDGSGRKWDHLENYPILAKRDLKYGYLKRFLNRQRKTFRRLRNKIFRI
jgi:hypothetical protein|tara:strand:- start:332 stop:1201 length:870 start_codon:yes stop_codon:yes gene_type:complete